MKIKKILILVVVMLGLIACNQKVDNSQSGITNDTNVDVDINDTNVVTNSNNLDTEIKIIFYDNACPGVQYKYTLDTINKKVTYDIYYESSVADVDSSNNSRIGETIVTDDNIWNKLTEVLETNVLYMDNDSYKYSNLVNILCYVLEDIAICDITSVRYDKAEVTVELWEDFYEYYDLNEDEQVTIYEDIIKSLGVILEDINNY